MKNGINKLNFEVPMNIFICTLNIVWHYLSAHILVIF